MCDALVKNNFGRAYFYAINTNQYDVKIYLKDVYLKDFEILNKFYKRKFYTLIRMVSVIRIWLMRR